MGIRGGGGSGVILTGRRFPGSSAPGDLSSFGVGGRPAGFWGGLCVGEEADSLELSKIQNFSLIQVPLHTKSTLFSYLPGEGAVILLFFLPGEEKRWLRGKLRMGTSGSDRLPHDFLTLSRSFCCWYRRWGKTKSKNNIQNKQKFYSGLKQGPGKTKIALYK